MNSMHIIVITIVCSCYNHAHGQVTFLDALTPLYRWYRYASLDFIGKSDNEWSYKWNLKRGVCRCDIEILQKIEFHLIIRRYSNRSLNHSHFSVTQRDQEDEAILFLIQYIN